MDRVRAGTEAAAEEDLPGPWRAPGPSVVPFQASGRPAHLTPAAVLSLQGSAGNAATSRVLGAAEAGFGETDPDQTLRDEEPVLVAAEGVAATVSGGSPAPVPARAGGVTVDLDALSAFQTVAPGGGPNRHNGGGNDCTPGRPTLTWAVVDTGATWKVDVTALRLTGEMHVTDWPSAPSSMTVPNTANPVDGGNINNTAGSPNHWQAAIDDMTDYDTVGGGRGPNWHSTAASSAHENAHWDGDYLGDALPAGNWAQTNTDLDAISIPKASAADAAAARVALEPLVAARLRTFNQAVIARWNVLITTTDKPGSGGRGYAAGQAVLNGLINGVRAYATAKGWNAPPAPPPGPAPGP
ncbi:hypothetical protein [Jidongwangia harbinensis]|uniref:hypothetical protein n=1 Tax=Jidongwangia harbinensis TaxID=2878561 RepID=UPI001CD9F766|nr:hypothetical protein [Jidongwangia harbinensis]MCA2218931.1 hypothetical protein [Jidongwangia harbinensis]